MNSNPRILVIGDIMLDQYVAGNVTRISPEAPVPVLKVDREWSTLGGAGNVAANVSSLGGQAIVLGLIGNDESAKVVRGMCEKQEIECHFFASQQPTITKTRIVSGQQIVRVDREEDLVWSNSAKTEFASIAEKLIQNCEVILLSDYAKGTLSDEILELVISTAKRFDKRILIDPKREDWAAYKGAHLITPNLIELGMTKAGSGVSNNDNEVVEACHKLRDEFQIENIVATRSSYGMTVVAQAGILNIPTRALEVFDVSGAGDTVLAAFGVALAEGKTVSDSAFFANAAAGVAVSKRGTAIVHRNELESLSTGIKKIISRDDVQLFKNSSENQKVVFTNGCFDVLHQGHREILKKAKNLGDKLVVGLNSDASISRLKGSDRPINLQAQRIEAIAALPFVDAVMVFEEDTPYELLEELRPNILVKGGDYQLEEIVGRNLVEKVVVIPLVEGFSTTKLVS